MTRKRDAGDFRKFLPGQFIDDLSELQVELNKLFGLLKIIFIILVFLNLCGPHTRTRKSYVGLDRHSLVETAIFCAAGVVYAFTNKRIRGLLEKKRIFSRPTNYETT